MISHSDVFYLFLEACPTFSAGWKEHMNEYGNTHLYLAAGDLSDHLLSLYKTGDTACFQAVADVIERLHTEDSTSLRELATIGILEGIQNGWASNNVDPEKFAVHLGQVSRWWWDSLNDFWAGSVPYVGFGA
jgi:hypothetical protein